MSGFLVLQLRPTDRGPHSLESDQSAAWGRNARLAVQTPAGAEHHSAVGLHHGRDRAAFPAEGAFAVGRRLESANRFLARYPAKARERHRHERRQLRAVTLTAHGAMTM